MNIEAGRFPFAPWIEWTLKSTCFLFHGPSLVVVKHHKKKQHQFQSNAHLHIPLIFIETSFNFVLCKVNRREAMD